MKTKRETVDAFRHAISGIVCDLLIEQRHGAELSLWLRNALKKIDLLSGELYDEITLGIGEKPSTNASNPTPKQGATK